MQQGANGAVFPGPFPDFGCGCGQETRWVVVNGDDAAQLRLGQLLELSDALAGGEAVGDLAAVTIDDHDRDRGGRVRAAILGGEVAAAQVVTVVQIGGQRAEGHQHVLQHRRQVVAVTRYHGNEIVAADMAEVGFRHAAESLAQHFGQQHDHGVATHEAVAIVEGLEAIQVDIDQRQFLLGTQLQVEGIAQHRSGRQMRQGMHALARLAGQQLIEHRPRLQHAQIGAIGIHHHPGLRGLGIVV